MLRLIAISFVIVFAVGSGPAWAQNEGQKDLDQATDAKWTAKSIDDLAKVIGLCESALEKGLDEGNAKLANDLLAGTLLQRGKIYVAVTLRSLRANPNWQQIRKLALADLEKSVKLSPEQPEALQLIAQLNLLPGGDRERSKAAIEEALELTKDDPERRATIMLTRADLEQDPAKKLAVVEEAIKVAPNSAAPLRVRGILHAAAGRMDKALADLNKAIELNPKHLPTYSARAAVLLKDKKFDEALASLEAGLKANPKAIQLLVEMSRVHGLQENHDAMLADLAKALEIEPSNMAVLLLRAQVYQKLKDYDSALADIDEILRLRPGLPTAKRMRIGLLASAEKFDEAIFELEQLRTANPADVLTLMQLGMLYNAQKQLDKAIDAYSAVLTAQPGQWMALRGRGDAYLNSGKQAEAVADYEKALKQQPEDSGILNNLSWVLGTSPKAELRDGDRALELATKACVATEYKQAHILSTLGAAYAEIGDFENAKKWVIKGLEIATDDQKEPLGKELDSYNAGKPVRELLRKGEPVDPDSEPEPDAQPIIPDI